jgi:8-oxo-dGTP diphosphatase
MRQKPVIYVVCAVIDHAGKILAVRRRKGEKMEGLWEFPGGKIEINEDPRISIIREISEELEVLVKPDHQMNSVIHDYPEFIIHLIPFHCYLLEGTIRLKVHDLYLWVLPSELYKINWCDADQKVIDEVVKIYNHKG